MIPNAPKHDFVSVSSAKCLDCHSKDVTVLDGPIQTDFVVRNDLMQTANQVPELQAELASAQQVNRALSLWQPVSLGMGIGIGGILGIAFVLVVVRLNRGKRDNEVEGTASDSDAGSEGRRTVTRQTIELEAQQGQGISRRAFVKRMGLGAAALAGCALLEDVQAAQASAPLSEGEASEEAVGVLIDVTRCTGCQTCALACKAENDLPQPEVVPTKLSSSAFTFVDTGRTSDGSETYVKRQCMHCVHPGCVSACTVGALRKTALGPVVYDCRQVHRLPVLPVCVPVWRAHV